MITDWATIAEPVPSPVFINPCYASDIQIIFPGKGIVLATPNGASLYRAFVDFDNSVDSEFVSSFSIPPQSPPVTPPFPVFGQCNGDLMILSPGKGILFPAGLASVAPRSFYRMRLDNDGVLVTDSVTVGYWMRLPENNIPISVDELGNWIFTQDIQMVTPGTGIVIPRRSDNVTKRVRIDFDGAILSE